MYNIEVIDRGIIDYKEAWELQKSIFDTVCNDKINADTLLFCEHPHVYTIGRSGDIENLLVNQKFLESINASLYKIDRGGDITYHGYGQIVGYPILSLEKYNISLKEYVYLLEECVINTIAHYGLKGCRSKGATGVWIESERGENKICAIGVKASRFVTMHGFALNVNTNLDYFNYINPCGFTNKGVTSISCELGQDVVDSTSVKTILTRELSTLLGCKIK